MRVVAMLSVALSLAVGCSMPVRDFEARAAIGHFAEADPSVVRSARLSISSDDPQRSVREAEGIAREHGGSVEHALRDSVLLRVPDARLEEMLQALAGLGDVTERELRAVDVSVEHRDLAIRLDNLERARARYQQLLERAKDVAEALAVERELERVTLEIERLQAARATIESRISRATVEVRFATESSPGPVGWIFYGLYHGVRWLFVWD